MSLISCLIITSLSLASRDKKSVKQKVYQRVQKREFTESIGSESVNHMSLITCHSFHVTQLMSHHYVTHLMSLISYLHLMSLIACLDHMSLITCNSYHVSSLSHSFHVCSLPHSSHVSSSRHSAWPQGVRKELIKRFTKGFREGNSQKVYSQSQLIACHSSHVTHLMSLISCLIITSLISCHSSHVSLSCHSFHVRISYQSSHVTHLISHHYLTHLMSHHYVTHLTSHDSVTYTKLLPLYSLVATFIFCPWTLPTSQRIILPVISAQPLLSNLCQPYSLFLPRRIRIGFQRVSHSSQYLSHVTYLMSHHYVTDT